MSTSPSQATDTRQLLVGLDVGSTTVKAVVVDPADDNAIVFKDYQRHETRQPEKLLEMLRCIEARFPHAVSSMRVFITGSGGGALAEYIGARFVQEVNAVSLAVEHYHPEAGSVIELGGQDAKIIIWNEDPATGQRRKLPSMNDKCAGGTGAVIDKIAAKLGLTGQQLSGFTYEGLKIHQVAGKCGVFAETDINGLQKQGVPPTELMASLVDALVQQNLSVLTRGNTLRPTVLLLGGPNTYIPALVEGWRAHIPQIWEERGFPVPEGKTAEELIVVPENAEYFAALGAILFGQGEEAAIGRYRGTARLVEYAENGRAKMREASGAPGLVDSADEKAEFVARFARPPFEPASFQPGQVVKAWVGLDGGSTSTKAVLLDDDANVLAKAYILSKGNPIDDSREVLAALRDQVEAQGASLLVKGLGTTGYAKDILKQALGADVALVETVAHTRSALHAYSDVDVIVDVGGQDIKVIVLNDGTVKDFKLNTQCSAGNGYFLQATANRFGYQVDEYADIAFGARHIPVFSYGCAVFMESDIVNFQQLGWSREEIMAGLAAVLPKNIWLYVVQEPNLGKLGKRFVLQGGTQNNLAAVKSQYDFIKQRVPDADVLVHPFCGESGAIGAALEAMHVVEGRGSAFVGFDSAEHLTFESRRDESTRCYFCKNRCLRTFIDTETQRGERQRFIIATCEKGAVEDVDEMRTIKDRIEQAKESNPSFVEIAAKEAFRETQTTVAPEPRPPLGIRLNPARKRAWSARREAARELRGELTIGMPRVLNMYSYAPFFRAYFEALGVRPRNIRFSDPTDEAMWREGSRRGSIDQCFPSKVALAHVHQLTFNDRKRPDILFFPSLATLRPECEFTIDSCACPTVAATPEVVKAAFTKESDVFAEHGIRYFDPVLNVAEPDVLERQMFAFAEPVLDVTEGENTFAVRQAYRALDSYLKSLRARGRRTLEDLEAGGRVGVVVLGRPYHNDPGLNHDIVNALQMCGYPVFTIDSLPMDADILDRLFGEEVARGVIRSARDISDVWKNAYSENSSRKIWAAKYVARHPNLVALDLSSFKCGHDAPMYHAVEAVVESSGTPYFTFHDIDENKPSGSIKIRVETIAYFLERYQDTLQERAAAEARIREAVRLYEQKLRRGERPERIAPAPPAAHRGQPAPLGIAMSPIGGGGSSGCSDGGCAPAAPAHAHTVANDDVIPLVSIQADGR